MGGKGRRRREKNYRAAHGGYNALPPPPNPSQVNALPSKLRQIISFTSSTQPGVASISKESQPKKKREDGEGPNNTHLRDKVEAEPTDVIKGDIDGPFEAPQHSSHKKIKQSCTNEKNKEKKRKRREVKDLRFEMEVEKTSFKLKRRERKKKYLEARKKRHKNTSTEENLHFPGHEKIKFGDIVEAPPKLNVIPKSFKNAQDASQARLQLKAIEAYRSRKGWTSRPGSHLPLPVTALTP